MLFMAFSDRALRARPAPLRYACARRRDRGRAPARGPRCFARAPGPRGPGPGTLPPSWRAGPRRLRIRPELPAPRAPRARAGDSTTKLAGRAPEAPDPTRTTRAPGPVGPGRGLHYFVGGPGPGGSGSDPYYSSMPRTGLVTARRVT